MREAHHRRNRRIFGWSFAAAALLHAWLLFGGPQWGIERGDRVGGLPGDGPSPDAMQLLDVSFGPPVILGDDGSRNPEPPGRTLEARDIDVARMPIPPGCEWVRRQGIGAGEAEVRLTVGPYGLVTRAELERSGGDPCVDHVLVVVAGTLWYRWLPDERYPPPVHLIQPIRAVRFTPS